MHVHQKGSTVYKYQNAWLNSQITVGLTLNIPHATINMFLSDFEYMSLLDISNNFQCFIIISWRNCTSTQAIYLMHALQ